MQPRARTLAALLATTLVALIAVPAHADNRLFIDQHTLEIGETGVVIPVRCENDREILAFSVALSYDEQFLDLSDALTVGVTLGSDFQAGRVGSGRVVYGVVLDFEAARSIPPASDTIVLELVAVVVATSPTVTSIDFRDARDDGDPTTPVEINLLVDTEGSRIAEMNNRDGVIFIEEPSGVEFRRGNANGDRSVDISDASFLLNFLFLGGADPACPDAADANDDGRMDISDASFILNFLFLGGTTPPSPGPTTCGDDPTDDPLGDCEDPLGTCA